MYKLDEQIIIDIEDQDLPEVLRFLEGKGWQKSNISGYLYRVDPCNSSMHQQRHVHIAHSRHIRSPNKQVSWNIDGSRHDKKNFDTSFAGIKNAKKIAIDVLELGSDYYLENVSNKKMLIDENISSASSEEKVILCFRLRRSIST